MQYLIEFLHSIHPLSPQLGDHLQKILKQKILYRKRFLLRSGQVCNDIYFIYSGLLKCFYTDEYNNEICSWFMKEGDVIVSVESFFRRERSYQAIQAVEDATLYGISHDDLQYIFRNYAEFNFVARELLQKYYCLAEQRLYSIRMKRASERFECFQETAPELLSRVPKKDIASYLGITPETLSRVSSASLHK